MNTEKQTSTSSPKKMKLKTDSLRVRRETKKKILAELAALNKKDFGKPITPDQYVSLAISLLTTEHLEQLKQRSLTNRDRIEMKYQEYCRTNGKTSKDEYLGILLKE